MRDFTVDELIIIRGALHESIQNALSMPNANDTSVFRVAVGAYRKVVELVDGYEPGASHNAKHWDLLQEAEPMVR